ncbi:hypothetical protein EVAR_48733_1 [Eumeta japonica]|uniref:Uncharacterized protein n=1 Tax=Eumeta variegata TaxID=151549 RepID=A0A4C1YIE8_EUMVA|nr:hypothetical protein EVAR_48733_1 [Eumeta japonica]
MYIDGLYSYGTPDRSVSTYREMDKAVDHLLFVRDRDDVQGLTAAARVKGPRPARPTSTTFRPLTLPVLGAVGRQESPGGFGLILGHRNYAASGRREAAFDAQRHVNNAVAVRA